MLQGIPCLITAQGTSSLLSGLQVYYALSDLTDQSGNGLTLTNNNGVTFIAGKVGNCADFVAASFQYLSCADATPFQMGTTVDFSIAAWLKFTSVTNKAPVTYGRDTTSGYGIQTTAVGTSIRLFIRDGTNQRFGTIVNPWNDGNWHLVIGTFVRGGNMTCYVDNVLEDATDITTVTGSVNNANGFNIGAQLAQAFFQGSIDEVGIWNRVLTASEQATLWNSGNGTTYPF